MIGTLVPFLFEGTAVRVRIDDAGTPWFNCGDVCAVLEFGNPRQAVESHVDAEDVQKLDTLTSGGRQSQNHVNESGLYALILGSTKDTAKRFKRWLTSEVLPSIRQTGSYLRAVVAAPHFEIPSTYSGALRLAADQSERADCAEARVAELEPKGEFVDRYVSANGTKGIREVCQVLDADERKFTHFLERDARVMYRLNGRLAPKSKHRSCGRFVVKTGVSDRGRAYNQARFTPKGIRWIAGLWAQFLLEPQAFRERHARAERTDEAGSNEEAAWWSLPPKTRQP
jgi:anti-repressor protein